jgi:gas vesicle structural protein
MQDNVVDRSKDITILEVLDRLLNKGAILTGDVVISVADIDLVYLGVKLILCSDNKNKEWEQLSRYLVES